MGRVLPSAKVTQKVKESSLAASKVHVVISWAITPEGLFNREAVLGVAAKLLLKFDKIGQQLE